MTAAELGEAVLKVAVGPVCAVSGLRSGHCRGEGARRWGESGMGRWGIDAGLSWSVAREILAVNRKAMLGFIKIDGEDMSCGGWEIVCAEEETDDSSA